MPRKRLTQVFPFLIPLRKWERKRLIYLKMCLDGKKYAKSTSEEILPYKIFETSSLMLNEKSGFDMDYQRNKIHNLKLAAETINGLVIKPGETFSFWKLVRDADKQERYKDGLVCIDGEIVGAYGGGLCQLSNLLYWMFLHTPLSIIERHGHDVESFPSTTENLPCGVDATVSEGWKDLKAENKTGNKFQIEIRFDEEYMYGSIFSDMELPYEYTVYNPAVSYYRKGGRTYQSAVVKRLKKNRFSSDIKDEELYCNVCEIAYELPDDIYIEDRGFDNEEKDSCHYFWRKIIGI